MTRIHIFPQCSELRKVLSNFLLDNYSHKRQYHNATSQIALSAIALVHGSKAKKYVHMSREVNFLQNYFCCILILFAFIFLLSLTEAIVLKIRKPY